MRYGLAGEEDKDGLRRRAFGLCRNSSPQMFDIRHLAELETRIEVIESFIVILSVFCTATAVFLVIFLSASFGLTLVSLSSRSLEARCFSQEPVSRPEVQ